MLGRYLRPKRMEGLTSESTPGAQFCVSAFPPLADKHWVPPVIATRSSVVKYCRGREYHPGSTLEVCLPMSEVQYRYKGRPTWVGREWDWSGRRGRGRYRRA